MRITRLAAVLTGTAASLLLLASPAFAHVTVHSAEATSGGHDAEITFRVPNERAPASTTRSRSTSPPTNPSPVFSRHPRPVGKSSCPA